MKQRKLLDNKTDGWIPKEPKMPQMEPKHSGKKIAVFISITLLIASVSVFSMPYFINHPTIPYSPIDPQPVVPAATPKPSESITTSPSPSSSASTPLTPPGDPTSSTLPSPTASPIDQTAKSTAIIISSKQVPQVADFNPQYSLNITYSYVGEYSSNIGHSSSDHFLGFPQSPTTWSGICFTLAFNATSIANIQNEAYSARFEIYSIRITADNGYTHNWTFYLGTNIDDNWVLGPNVDMIAGKMLSFDGDQVTEGGFFAPNFHLNDSIIGIIKPTGELRNLGIPTNLTMSIERIGWIIYNDSTGTSYLTSQPEVLSQATLERLDGGYIFNSVLP